MMKSWEPWHLHHLARRARIFGIERPLAEALDKVGWLLARNQAITEQLNNQLEKALERLGSINNFAKTCEDKDCHICFRLAEEYATLKKSEPWKLNVELYRWQKVAKKLWWENNGKGIVKVVTGAGKTVLALALLSDVYNSEAYKNGGVRTAIIVPTTVLLDQWLFNIMDKLNVPRNKIAVFYGKEKDPLQSRQVFIYVVNSARDNLVDHIQACFPTDDMFLIADECHRYGSKENSRIFEKEYSYTLGLSATPERYGDRGFEEKIQPNLGRIIYNYTYSDALKDGIIPPYKLTRLRVSLLEEEEKEYNRMSLKISHMLRFLRARYPELRDCGKGDFIKNLGQVYAKTKDSAIPAFTSLVNQRKSVIHTSIAKRKALIWLIENENMKDNKILLFHERIGIANLIFQYLKKNGFQAGIYHTGISLEQRIKNITDYRTGKTKILVSCRALDEGFDVPESEIGIIVAGTSSVRQWIQRMGRILRKTPGKEYSTIYVIFADIVEKDVFKEAELKDFEKEALSVQLIKLSFGQKNH